MKTRHGRGFSGADSPVPRGDAHSCSRLGGIGGHCETTSTRSRTVTLKVKYDDFHQITRSKTCDAPVATQDELEQFSFALLEAVFPVTKGIRLLGVTLSSLGEELHKDDQLRLSL
ncbi:MAG: hypothetical protein AB7O60_01425 [Variibacter sp.]